MECKADNPSRVCSYFVIFIGNLRNLNYVHVIFYVFKNYR